MSLISSATNVCSYDIRTKRYSLFCTDCAAESSSGSPSSVELYQIASSSFFSFQLVRNPKKLEKYSSNHPFMFMISSRLLNKNFPVSRAHHFGIFFIVSCAVQLREGCGSRGFLWLKFFQVFQVCIQKGKYHILLIYRYLRPWILIYDRNPYQLSNCRSNSCT